IFAQSEKIRGNALLEEVKNEARVRRRVEMTMLLSFVRALVLILGTFLFASCQAGITATDNNRSGGEAANLNEFSINDVDPLAAAPGEQVVVRGSGLSEGIMVAV